VKFVVGMDNAIQIGENHDFSLLWLQQWPNDSCCYQNFFSHAQFACRFAPFAFGWKHTASAMLHKNGQRVV